MVDLFCGLKGWSRPFTDRGHDVVTVDIDPKFEPTVCEDIFNLTDLCNNQATIVLASPPCEHFSVMSIGRHWNKDHTPKTQEAERALALVTQTRALIERINPQYFIIENPRAKLRKLAPVSDLERRTVWYCRLGEKVAKPTDLWGVFPEGLILPAECHNGNPDHLAAPRGSTTGTQGPRMSREEKAKVPYALGLTVCLAIENPPAWAQLG